MSNKSFLEIINSLKVNGYKFTFTDVETTGDYFPEDVDWNDKDVKHLNIVHTKVEGLQAVVSDKVMSSIYFQTLPYVGFKIPITVNSYEYSKFNIIYYTLYGPFIVLVNSVSRLIEDHKTQNVITFAIGSKKIFKIFHPLIKKLLAKNNKLLMSEDLPMRERRGVLRKNNHTFFSNSETYSYNFSMETYRANVSLKNDSDSLITIKKSELINSVDQQIIGRDIGINSFFITIDNNGNKKLWQSTCTHEGAPLNKKCLKKDILLCPWHNRKIFPLLIIDQFNKLKIFENIDYAIKEENEFIKIRYRNDPSYYNKKPYTFLKY
tara:strand:- start:138 stop:1100 length:963 start_codon:yes stop_codon:yes gene_type:complete